MTGKGHIPKVDTGDDVDFMCGTHAFGAVVDLHNMCRACVRRTLEIVELLTDAHDELRALNPTNRRTIKVMRRIDKALGKRVLVDWKP